jgi:hypothetical protein
MKILNSEEKQKQADCYSIFTNAGMVVDAESPTGYLMQDDGEPVNFTINDLLSKTDLTRFIPSTIQLIVREALEPNLLMVPNLFTQLNVPTGRVVQIGSVGAMAAAMIPEAR